jgi:hypothetical protein
MTLVMLLGCLEQALLFSDSPAIREQIPAENWSVHVCKAQAASHATLTLMLPAFVRCSCLHAAISDDITLMRHNCNDGLCCKSNANS